MNASYTAPEVKVITLAFSEAMLDDSPQVSLNNLEVNGIIEEDF